MHHWVHKEFSPGCSTNYKTWWTQQNDLGLHSGGGEMFMSENRMNSLKYINFLEFALLPTFKTLFVDTNLMINSSTKTYHVINLDALCHGFLNRPDHIPDLSTVQYLCSLLKSKVQAPHYKH